MFHLQICVMVALDIYEQYCKMKPKYYAVRFRILKRPGDRKHVPAL
jgi:hypothetical protein